MPPNKLKSKIWTYFNKAGDKEAVCKICNKTLKTSGNTSNLRGHLENVHSQQLADEDVKSKKAKTAQPALKKVLHHKFHLVVLR
ncbi:E3 SUMO-protein ligase ZBED1-like [Lucilia cuprina]|uniref:E3 SUMO-protein ligase ZBED1-like n=1 Tax=Lucilia cuprina TaxID=7375 RepID=UPI001F056670|nr:E3 SUMO-protein ligase ZBED1-like [Lucilia cuprina]